MMMSEFIERTGYEPDSREYYDAIEPAYYEHDGDKNTFCEWWKRERRAGRWEREKQLRYMVADAERAAREAVERAARIDAEQTARKAAVEQLERVRQEYEEQRNSYECLIQNYYEPELEKLRKEIERRDERERIKKRADEMLKKFLTCGA